MTSAGKFPDDVVRDNLPGQLWFGAECLAAGVCHLESRGRVKTRCALSPEPSPKMPGWGALPPARAVLGTAPPHALYVPPLWSNQMGNLKTHLKPSSPSSHFTICDASIDDSGLSLVQISSTSSTSLINSLGNSNLITCRPWCLSKPSKNITFSVTSSFFFSETLQRSLQRGFVTQDAVDLCEPSLKFTIPHLAIVAGLVLFPEGPLNNCGEKNKQDFSQTKKLCHFLTDWPSRELRMVLFS